MRQSPVLQLNFEQTKGMKFGSIVCIAELIHASIYRLIWLELKRHKQEK